MPRKSLGIRLIGIIALGAPLLGCNARQPVYFQHQHHPDLHHYVSLATQIEYPDVDRATRPAVYESLGPRILSDEPEKFWDLGLRDVIEIALENSEVMRDVGGRVLQLPQAARTIYDPAIRESDPRYGPEGALSAFDTQLSTDLFWSKNDRAVNSVIAGEGVNEFQQDLNRFTAGLTKTAATGTQFTARNLTVFDANNGTTNIFPSGWDTQFDFSIRQPLLQGAGITFNRIAGPNAEPGFYFSNGVLIGRVNTDISLAQFEAAVRDLIRDVEDAYWELYFAYRDLDAKLQARDRALETWQSVQARYRQQLVGSADEAQAREQYFAFQDEVVDAVNGSPVGSVSVGVYNGERRLRRLMGLAANDGRLIRPADDPPEAMVRFRWESCLAEALTRRVELRQQMWQTKRRELELVAARNFLLPRLDAVALYRFRGFGDDLMGSGPGRFASAYKDLASGDHQEWETGLQLHVPIGSRRAFAGVRYAELQLTRERALLREQEFQISHDLHEAMAEQERAATGIRSNLNRLVAAQQNTESIDVAFRKGLATVDALLRSQQRLSQSQSAYYRSLTDYAKAITKVHFQKGSLLDSGGVYLSEGQWPQQAYRDAQELARRWKPKCIDYRHTSPSPISRGPYAQHRVEDSYVDEISPAAMPPAIEALPMPETATDG